MAAREPIANFSAYVLIRCLAEDAGRLPEQVLLQFTDMLLLATGGPVDPAVWPLVLQRPELLDRRPALAQLLMRVHSPAQVLDLARPCR